MSKPSFSADVSPSQDVLTLSQCFQWARTQSEELKIMMEDIAQSKARARASFGGVLPQISWNWMDTWQDPAGVDKLNSKGFSGFVEKDQVESKFTARQALFSGLQEFSATAGFKHESRGDQLLLERAEKELYETVADIFYAIEALETDQKNTKAASELADERVKELREFRRLGKARESEVYTAKAHAAALKGALDQIAGRVHSARQELSYLTGINCSDLPLAINPSLPDAPKDVEFVLSKALERSDIRAQREYVAGEKLRIRYERGAYFPSADLIGNYYTQRATFLKDIDWDLVLAVEFPLFRGGKTDAAVDQAISQYRQAFFMLQGMERRIEMTVKKIHGELTAALREADSMNTAAVAAEESYRSLQREYRLGLVTNLDVLQSMDFLLEQQRNRDNARLAAKRLAVRLNVAMEEMP